MNNETAVVTREQQQGIEAFSPHQVLQQVALIQQIMSVAMKDKEHYGTIPGCGEKKTLLKPGAEKLCLTFRFRPELQETVIDLANGHREYRVKCSLFSIVTGNPVGQGIGSCSTMESKYRYRTENTGKPVPKDYWTNRNPELIGGNAYSTRKIDGQWFIFHKVEHENPADYHNTCLKMAKKRALVDSVLTATAASDCFTQDIEDIEENMSVHKPAQEVQDQPQATNTAPRATERAPAAPAPQEAAPAGDWRGVKVHFGKHSGKALGELDARSLGWFQNKWEPSDWPTGSGKYKQVDLDLKKALNASMNQTEQRREEQDDVDYGPSEGTMLATSQELEPPF